MTVLLTAPRLKDLRRSLSLTISGIANPRTAANAKTAIPADVTKAAL